jgi:hypothetical protein
MSDTLTDDHHDWATSFRGIDTRGSPAADESNGSGVTVLPEVTIVGDPASADTDDQSAPNVTTIPEVTVEGSAALAVSDPLAASVSSGPFRDPGQPTPDPPPHFPEIQPPKGWPPSQPWPPEGSPPAGWPDGEKWPPGPIWPGNKPWPVPIPGTPDPAPAPSDDSTLKKIATVLIVLGLSVDLVVTVSAAMADPEPATKLLLAGLTVAEVAALAAVLGFKPPAESPSA